ncbi:RBBP9/YdeN family alpha/beta hydrolase [Limosilactobacillus mucosae]|uniref:RBBP9/YdeN family alpha/beta hydrolase n=2 Tax=Limosilactobacillus mucosae TaxID=97478 RepID=UPI003EBF4C43
MGKASVLIVFSDLIIRGRLSLFQFNLEIYTKYFTLPAVDDQIKAEDGIKLVAHSLGCITAVRWLARHDVKNVGLLLVGAFDQPLPNYAGLDEFMQGSVDYRQVRPKISRATVIVAQNDPIAPYQFGVAMANRLGAKLIVRPDGGHFLTSDGFKEFPLALTELKRVAGVE